MLAENTNNQDPQIKKSAILTLGQICDKIVKNVLHSPLFVEKQELFDSSTC